MNKPKCMLTVDVEALKLRAASNHVKTLIYGQVDGGEYGIGRMMDIADKHHVKMTFFVDFAEWELYGDEILKIGRYIVSRGHDMQVHCHYNWLEKIVGKPSWVNISENYYSWYKDEADAKVIIDYVTDKYVQCTGKMPVAYRGGEYRFGIGVLKALKEKGYQADLSYNYLRPEILPVNKQFRYENELLELPIGILPNKKPLNFNYRTLMPEVETDFDKVIDEYKELFDAYYAYYGPDAIATMLMHSWSFMYDFNRFDSTGFFDKPNEILVSFFDYFVESFKDKVDFISVTEGIELAKTQKLKTADFHSIFPTHSSFSIENLVKISDFINKKAKGRQVVIWGKGWMESTVFRSVNFHKSLNTAYYISNDADRLPVWRGKPVYKFSDVTLSPEKDYVFVLAQATFSEIRDSLRELGFKDFEDFYDIQKKVPVEQSSGVRAQVQHICPICGGQLFETYNSDKPRRCAGCGSLERTRTIPKLMKENTSINLAKTKILHISPSNSERKFFKDSGVVDITTIDIRPECRVDIVADICNMPQVESESFDMVFANCVLNHVYDDEKAIQEIHRVLRTAGRAVLYVQDSGMLKTVVHDDPTGWYGKENYEKYKIGTFRHYGEVDFTQQLRRHFADVRCYDKYDDVTDTSCKWYQCIK